MSGGQETVPRIAILLPTFNGAHYLQEQIDSLLAQDYENFVIVTRDDGSSDASVAIIEQNAGKFPERFHILKSDGENIGACAGFSTLMEYVLDKQELLGLNAVYMMFCDQDDVWHSDKVSQSVAAILALEKRFPYRACLVHSDLRVVDETLEPMADSFFEYQGLRPRKRSFARFLVSNSVTGCTAIVNEKLAALATPVPKQAIMHDWWLALLAAAFGHIETIEAPLIDYRQHQQNTVGAKPYASSKWSIRKIKGAFTDPVYDEVNRVLVMQASAFAGLHHHNIKNKDTFVLMAALWMGSKARIVRNAVLKAFLSLST